VDACKKWMLQQQRSDMALGEVVAAVAEEVGDPSGSDRRRNDACLSLLSSLRSAVAGKKSEPPRAAFEVPSVNAVLSLTSALLLDGESSRDERDEGLAKLAGLIGTPPLGAEPCLSVLSPASKGIFLYLSLTASGSSRLTLTTWREDSLEGAKRLLDHAGCVARAGALRRRCRK
jgi:hypothetical protein